MARVDWARVRDHGTGYIRGGDDDIAALEARHATWTATQEPIAILERAGANGDLLRSCALRLAEIAARVQQIRPATIPQLETALEQLAKPFVKDEPRSLGMYEALHYVDAAARGPAPPAVKRSRGQHGEPDALRVLSGLAEHLRRRAPDGRVPWILVLRYRDAIFPPLFTGIRLRTGAVLREPGMPRPTADRLRQAVATHRRDYGRKNGVTPAAMAARDLRAVTALVARLPRHARRKRIFPRMD